MKENKGITLIALVITIIIMLILAGVTIGLVFNGDLIRYAKTAKTNTQEQIEGEQLLASGVMTDGTTIDELVNGLPKGWDETKVTVFKEGTIRATNTKRICSVRSDD